jgi:hypothetical protein
MPRLTKTLSRYQFIPWTIIAASGCAMVCASLI